MFDLTNKTSYVTYEDHMRAENQNTNPVNFDDIDMSVLREFEDVQCEGEPDLIVELIDLYLADAPDQLLAMKDFVLKANQVSLKRTAHTLKGSSANLGANGMATLCQELELCESLHQANILINNLEQAFDRVRTAFLAERQSRV